MKEDLPYASPSQQISLLIDVLTSLPGSKPNIFGLDSYRNKANM